MYCWGAAFLTFSFVQKYIQIKFFSEFVASAVVISIAAIFTKLGIAQNQDIITIASVMPLVPGILITNAIRDLLAGELLAECHVAWKLHSLPLRLVPAWQLYYYYYKKGC